MRPPFFDETDWVYAGNLQYGRKHLIDGLHESRAA